MPRQSQLILYLLPLLNSLSVYLNWLGTLKATPSWILETASGQDRPCILDRTKKGYHKKSNPGITFLSNCISH